MGRKKQGARPVFTVILRRKNGRFVKEVQRPSRYAAKLLADAWDEKYDDGFYTEVVPGTHLS